MGTLAFFHFLIILSIILNGFNDADGYRCGCRHKRLPRECRSKKPIKGADKNRTDVKANCHQVKVETKKFTTEAPKRTTIIGPTAAHSELICVSAYDVLLLTANFNQLIVDIKILENNVAAKDSKSNKEINFSPIFDVENVDGCFKLKLNTDYANIFGEPVQGFLTNDLIDGINPLVERDEKTKSCPNENDANMLIAINLCAVGKSFSDQMGKAQNITDKILQNSVKQLDSMKANLTAQYETLYNTLVANGYEKQLKSAIILREIDSGGYMIKLCEPTNTGKTRRPLGSPGEWKSTTPSIPTIIQDEKKKTWDVFAAEKRRNFQSFDAITTSADYFSNSKQEIDRMNADYEKGHSSFFLGYNEYSDQKECPKGKAKGRPKANYSDHGIPSNMIRDSPGAGKPPPQQIDFRTFGAITPVVDQGRICGSCYSFSAVVCLEFLHFKKTNKLEALSKQQYIDCVTPPEYYCFGCKSGFPDELFQYLVKGKHGCELDFDYPYTAAAGKCKYNSRKTVLNIGGWQYASCDFYPTCPQNDEKSMQSAVANNGPIVACVYAGCSDFKNYKGGIYDSTCCSGKTSEDTDHAMAIVGYGTDPKKGDYWILKNSYGSEWGENGYMRMKRGINQCGVATGSLYATL